LHRVSIRSLCLAFEAQRIRLADAGAGERCSISGGILRFKNEQREALAARNEILIVRPEHRREAVGADLLPLCQCQQFNENAWQLNDVIVRPPWVPVARAYGEAKSPIEIGGGIEVAHGVDDMIETASHRCDTTPTGYARLLPR